MGTLQGSLEGIILVTQMLEFFFTSVTLHERPALRYFLPLFYVLFNCLKSLFFFRCSWYYSEGYFIKETFLQHVLLLVAILRYSEAHFRVWFHILESCSASYFMKFCTDCITLTVNMLRKISQHASLNWGHYAVVLGLFWVYSPMSWET